MIGLRGAADSLGGGKRPETTISYFVTYHGAPESDRARLRGLILDRALRHACGLIGEGKRAVSIKDTRGHEIGGDELSACCRGEKLLTFTLRAEARTA